MYTYPVDKVTSIHTHTHTHACTHTTLLVSPPFPLLQAPLYYRKANAALVLYDITKQASFEEAKGWVAGTFADEALGICCSYKQSHGGGSDKK